MRERRPDPEPESPLSPREREVLALIALGLSNREISDRLVIAVATTERHVHSILTKLGCPNRTAAAAVAAAHAMEAPPPDSAPDAGGLRTIRRDRTEPSGLGKVTRGFFVGREGELQRLRAAFDRAVGGRGSLAMLVGEPGIGKTRTAQELESYARARGARVLWGRSHERSGAPSYWPWIQVGRQWDAANDLRSLQSELTQTHGELARLFPELRSTPGFIEPAAINDREGAQFRLFEAYSALVRAIAARGPLLIVLDDLHWADRPTLQLLEHLAREISESRVLILSTYRQTEMSRAHPLRLTLAAINRDPGFQRVTLYGLSRDEAARYVRAAAPGVVEQELVEKICAQTEGNPFFLGEVLTLLAQEGTLRTGSGAEIPVPERVNEALGRRLDRLSKDALDLLRIAATMGREFDYETLTLLSDHSDEALVILVEEAIEARVIEEMTRAGQYRFTHALMLDTVLGELSATRRMRLNGKVGDALERRSGDRANEDASRLATHFTAASTLNTTYAAKARHYAEIAARQAEAQFAWAEAYRWYEVALASEEDPHPDLLTHLVKCNAGAVQDASIWRTLQRAFDGYRRRRDLVGLARALVDSPNVADWANEQVVLIEELLRDAVGGDVELGARLLAKLWWAKLWQGAPPTETQAVAERLVRVLEDADIPERDALHHWAKFVLGPDPDEAVEAARAYEKLARFEESAMLLGVGVGLYVMTGQLTRCESTVAELEAFQRRYRHMTASYWLDILTPGLALFRWREVHRRRVVVRGVKLECFAWIRQQDILAGVTKPKPEGYPPTQWEPGSEPDYESLFNSAVRAEALLAIDGKSAARPHFQAWADEWRAGVALSNPATRVDAFCHAAACVGAFGDDALWAEVWEEVRSWHNRCGLSGIAADPLRGQLALRLDLVNEAAQCFEEGLEWAEREGCPIEAGRNLQGLADVAERRGDIAGALAYLDRATAIYKPRGARMFLKEVRAARARITGVRPQTRRSAATAGSPGSAGGVEAVSPLPG